MVMLERPTRLISEELARLVDRRTFLKRASAATMGTLMALAAGHGLAGTASARRQPGSGGPQTPPTISCAPPGPYCNTGGGDLSGCHGGHCFQHLYQGQVLQCRTWQCCYQAGCWTTQSGNGYWTCCDCQCYNNQGQAVTTCGCAQYNGPGQPPPPLPDQPGGGGQ
jgi:hypothetical protein